MDIQARAGDKKLEVIRKQIMVETINIDHPEKASSISKAEEGTLGNTRRQAKFGEIGAFEFRE